MRAIHYATGEVISIGAENGIVKYIDRLETRVADDEDLPLIAPGLVDLQVNGYAGHDINALPLGEETLGRMIRGLWREGVTTCFPTVITNSTEAITDAMKTLAQSCERDAEIARCVGGIHLEGPFITPDDGARGAHDRRFVRAPDWEQFCRWQEAAGGRIRIVTMSPEWPQSGEFITRATKSGVTVSIGHTSATPAQVADAVRAGARMCTHFGNGAHLMLPRHPNYLWEELAQDDLWACVIADGFHLPDQVLKVVLRVKGERTMLVSDAVALAGMPPGRYTTPVGGEVLLTPQGRLHLAENEKLLAGSAQMLTRGIEHLTRGGLASLWGAWDMASIRPSVFMNLPTAAALVAGAPADFALFAWHRGEVKLRATYKAGEAVFLQK
jgi:N-acetylglucosamine-6-phosphate deacetylase